MAYQPYNYNPIYTPSIGQQNYIPQQYLQTQAYSQPQNNGALFNDVRMVSDDAEAKAFIVNPNQRVMLMNTDKQIFYIKSADGLGKSVIECFEYKPMSADLPMQQKEISINSDLFVKKDDLIEDIKKINQRFDAIESKLEKTNKIVSILGEENVK